MTSSFPILIVGDSVTCTTGLGRVARELCQRVTDTMPEVEVASAGYGAPASSRLPWMQYYLGHVDNWILPDLPHVWNDFSNGRKGAIFFIWDASRLGWFADPAQCRIPHLQQWLLQSKGRFQKWVYGAVDAEGVGGSYPLPILDIMRKFDRVLNYTEWASTLTGFPDHLPHGTDTSIFHPRTKWKARKRFKAKGFKQLTQESTLLSAIATNQLRKDWPLAFETMRILVDRGVDALLWAHTDTLSRYWNIMNLINDFKLHDRVAVTQGGHGDDDMAWMMSAADVSLGIGLGEGWGLPMAENLACGVPVVHGAYGGGVEVVPKSTLVEPVAWRYEGLLNFKRPVFDAKMWADKVQELIGVEAALPKGLSWDECWPKWREWIIKGINQDEPNL